MCIEVWLQLWDVASVGGANVSMLLHAVLKYNDTCCVYYRHNLYRTIFEIDTRYLLYLNIFHSVPQMDFTIVPGDNDFFTVVAAVTILTTYVE